jgi:hypothetical protein
MLDETCANIHMVNSLWFSFASPYSFSFNLDSGDVYIVTDKIAARETFGITIFT